jgi:acetyltransferase EpsM
MVLYGASGHAKVIIESIQASGGKITGIFDDNESIKEILGMPVLGKYNEQRFPNSQVVISIGSNEIRKKIAGMLSCSFGKVIHPFSFLSSSSVIAEGTVVMAGVVLNGDCKIGRHVILNTSSSIDHDCTIADFVHISPGATICGGVTIGEGAQIGAGATVIQNVNIGKWAVVGAGSVIVNDIPDYSVVTGVPGKVVKVISH